MKLHISEADLTVGDLEDIEDYTGQQFTGFEPGPDGQVKVGTKMLTALIWITERRANPDFSVADARKTKVSELEVGVADPTPAAGGNGSTP